jgi:hypothetical protein
LQACKALLVVSLCTVLQNAECVGLFPLPVARPGFYPLSLEEYASCVPAEACPGVDSAALRTAFTWPAGNGTLGCVSQLRNFHPQGERNPALRWRACV